MIVTVSLLFPRIVVNLSLAFLETLSSSEAELSPPEEVKYWDAVVPEVPEDPEDPDEKELPLLPPVSPPSRLLRSPVS